jgi:hypothetical protein
MADQGKLRGQRHKCRGGRSVDAMLLLSRTLKTRADGAIHHSQITNSGLGTDSSVPFIDRTNSGSQNKRRQQTAEKGPTKQQPNLKTHRFL